MSTQRRGSDSLIEAYRAGSSTIEEELIEELARMIGERQLHDVLIKGQPAVDFVRARFSAHGPADAGAVVGELLGSVIGASKVPGSVRVFPRGLPWPEEFTIDLVLSPDQV